jgi:hypothetical protein
MVADPTKDQDLLTFEFTWEHCIAHGLNTHAKNNRGKIDFATVFGIDQKYLEIAGMPNVLRLEHFKSTRITSKDGWFQKGTPFFFFQIV